MKVGCPLSGLTGHGTRCLGAVEERLSCRPDSSYRVVRTVLPIVFFALDAGVDCTAVCPVHDRSGSSWVSWKPRLHLGKTKQVPPLRTFPVWSRFACSDGLACSLILPACTVGGAGPEAAARCSTPSRLVTTIMPRLHHLVPCSLPSKLRRTSSNIVLVPTPPLRLTDVAAPKHRTIMPVPVCDWPPAMLQHY